MKKTHVRLLLATLLAAALHAGAAPIDLSPVRAAPSPITLPAHWHRGVFMEIFVRAYQDSDGDGDGVGDLKGLVSHAFADGLVLGCQRRLGKERTLVLINYGREAAQVRVRGVSARTRLTALHPVPNAEQRGARLLAPPRSVQVFDLR